MPANRKANALLRHVFDGVTVPPPQFNYPLSHTPDPADLIINVIQGGGTSGTQLLEFYAGQSFGPKTVPIPPATSVDYIPIAALGQPAPNPGSTNSLALTNFGQGPLAEGGFIFGPAVVTAAGRTYRADIGILSQPVPQQGFSSSLVTYEGLMPAINNLVQPQIADPVMLTSNTNYSSAVWAAEGSAARDLLGLNGYTIADAQPFSAHLRSVGVDLIDGGRGLYTIPESGGTRIPVDLASTSDFLVLEVLGLLPQDPLLAAQQNTGFVVYDPTALTLVALRTFITLPNGLFLFGNDATINSAGTTVSVVSDTELYLNRDRYLSSDVANVPFGCVGLLLAAYRSNGVPLNQCSWRLVPGLRGNWYA